MFRFLVSALHVAALLTYVPSASAQSVVGDIVFASGEVHLANAGAARTPKVGEPIKQGDELITKADGYIYVKTRDQGFVSLRPNTAVQFDIYEYAADKPQESRIKTTLKYGVLRSVSGVGAQSAKDKYRLNTPVAAIGIRGTDFTVFANAEVTRATVTSGGIVMSGFNDSCAPSGSGPCNGIQGAELYAQQSGMMLQLRRGDNRPVLLERDSMNLQPDAVSPPLPGEKPDKNAANGNTISVDLAGSQAITIKQGVALQEKLELATRPSSQVAPVQPSQQVFWGRFVALTGGTVIPNSEWQALLEKGKQRVHYLGPFGLAREPQTDMVFPSAGVYNFAFQKDESYILNTVTSQMTPATMENASLAIDFNRQRFETKFQLVNPTHRVNVASEGDITRNGLMYSDSFHPVTVQGALANGGQQAGYLYDTRINAQERAVGATYWSR